MFEVKCLVGDKHLIQVLNLLDGHTLEPPVVLPVNKTLVTAVVNRTNGQAPAPSNGTRNWTTVPGGSVSLMRSFIKNHKTVTAKQMREHCEANGYSKNGYSYSIQKLIKEGALKKSKSAPNTYEVVR